MAEQLTITLKNVRIGKLTISCDDQETLNEFLASLKNDIVSEPETATVVWPKSRVPREGAFRIFG